LEVDGGIITGRKFGNPRNRAASTRVFFEPEERSFVDREWISIPVPSRSPRMQTRNVVTR